MDYQSYKSVQKQITDVESLRGVCLHMRDKPTINMFANRMRRLVEIGPDAANMGVQEMHILTEYKKEMDEHFLEQESKRKIDEEMIVDESVGVAMQLIDDKLGKINNQLSSFNGSSQLI